MWYGHTPCARGCQYMNGNTVSDIQHSIAGNLARHRHHAEVMEEDPV